MLHVPLAMLAAWSIAQSAEASQRYRNKICMLIAGTSKLLVATNAVCY
jgi:hypothetical protein